jgi:hypothetical protein
MRKLNNVTTKEGISGKKEGWAVEQGKRAKTNI